MNEKALAIQFLLILLGFLSFLLVTMLESGELFLLALLIKKLSSIFRDAFIGKTIVFSFLLLYWSLVFGVILIIALYDYLH